MQSSKPSIRVYFSLRPDDVALEGLYRHLASLPNDAARVYALRQVLVLRERIENSIATPTQPPRHAIRFRIVFSARDVGLEKLHDELIKQPSDTHRRAALKNAVAKIYLGGNPELPPTQIEPRATPPMGTASTHEEAPMASEPQPSNENDRLSQVASQQATMSAKSPDFHLVAIPEISVTSEIMDPAPSDDSNKGSSDFKRRMREASRAFEF